MFSGVFAIVGDDQSVAENLSTFSAFVRQLRQVLAAVDDRSLVLLDELGAGTDPDDGAALAQAVLEELAERGALCVVEIITAGREYIVHGDKLGFGALG